MLLFPWLALNLFFSLVKPGERKPLTCVILSQRFIRICRMALTHTHTHTHTLTHITQIQCQLFLPYTPFIFLHFFHYFSFGFCARFWIWLSAACCQLHVASCTDSYSCYSYAFPSPSPPPSRRHSPVSLHSKSNCITAPN